MPSAISDWLEEQLEARGIDAIVYTRYVLSLLHRDSLDLVSTDQDIQIPKVLYYYYLSVTLDLYTVYVHIFVMYVYTYRK